METPKTGPRGDSRSKYDLNFIFIVGFGELISQNQTDD